MRTTLLIISIFLFQSLQAQEFVEKIFLRSYTQQELTAFVGLPVTYSVDLYKVLYTSIELDGSPDTLSGLLAQPVSENLLHPLHIYCHGTVDSREDVPSRLSFESIIPAVFAGFGYTTIAPDYLGYGDSNAEIHPYVHAESEARACFDMLKSISDMPDESEVSINDQLFISGYSQGGHAGMALHRFLENANLDVTAASHMSGPYSISKDMVEFTLAEQNYDFVSYIPLTTISYQNVYGNLVANDDVSLAFKEPYASEIKKFSDGEYTLSELNDVLMTNLISEFGSSIGRYMIRDSFLNEIFNNPNSTVNQALRDNDVYDWAPEAPTRLYYCTDDDQVTFQNAITASEAMIANGSTSVSAINIGPGLTHSECVTPAVTLTLFFFNSLQDILSNNEDVFVNEGVEVYPNPADNILFIKDQKYSSGRARIYDFTGKIVRDQNISSGQLSVAEIPSGPYILEWITDNYSYTQKLIIK